MHKFDEKTITALNSKNIQIMGVKNIPDPYFKGIFADIIPAYKILDDGIQRLWTFDDVIRAAFDVEYL